MRSNGNQFGRLNHFIADCGFADSGLRPPDGSTASLHAIASAKAQTVGYTDLATRNALLAKFQAARELGSVFENFFNPCYPR
jgi:hypothetical protein